MKTHIEENKDRVNRALEGERFTDIELRRRKKDGEPVYVQVSTAPLRDRDETITGVMFVAKDISAQRHHQEELQNRQGVLRDMYEIMADPGRPFDNKVDDLLRLGRSELETAYGTLSKIEGEDYMFEFVDCEDDSIQAGDIVPVSATNCEIVADTQQRVVLGDISRDAPEETHRAGFTDYGIACYIGAPVYLDDEVYGTFCFYDKEPREGEFSEWEETLVDLMSRYITYELQRHLATDDPPEENTS